jgi:signal transduction histidine kinase
MFRSLRTKLTVLYAGLFALALSLVAVLVYAAVSTNAERAVRSELVTSGAVFDRVRALRVGHLQQSAEVLAHDFGFREAAATGDAATIGSALDSLRERSGADLALMVGADGHVVSAGDGWTAAAAPAIRKALERDEQAAGAVRIGTTLYQATSAPILTPTLSGWLVVAVRIDEAELTALEKLSAIPLDATVLQRGPDGAWTGPAAAATGPAEARLLSRHVDAAMRSSATRPDRLRFSDGASVVLAKPLPSMTGRPDAVLLLRYPMARALAPFQSLMRTILVLGAMALALVVAGGWALARSVTRPLSALDQAARRLQRGEDDVEAPPAGRDEVGRLAQTFNAMAAAIRERERRIRQDAETLAIALDQAQSANRATNDFLANMSHELRTPLNGVLGLSRILVQTTTDPAQRKMVEAIEGSATGLEQMLGDVLDAARLKAGQMEVRAAPFDLGEAVRRTAGLWRSAAADKGLGLTVEIAPEAEGRVVGDSERMQQILGNLLSNAVKFTEAGAIRLTAGREPGGAMRFQVRDTGIGFDPAVKERLFERFQQNDTSSTRRYGGSGLGLHISRSLAGLMGGTLDADSRPGDGATFTLRLDLPRAEDPASLAARRAG